jgi:dienelactone hydrolase
MKNKFLRLFAACLLLVSVAFEAEAAFTPPDHYLISYKLKYSYTRDSLLHFWKKNKIPQVAVRVRYAVDMYEVTYKGLWLDSSFIMAKGVMYVPRMEKPSAEMVYCHGTRIAIPQDYGIQDLEQVVCMMHAVDGYIALFPFYYGLGGGEKEHVYQDSWTEAMSVIYMIKACREIYPQIGKSTTGQLFLTGYSQGGHASMATHKMLESGAFPEITLTASAPMSGAYDMLGAQSKTMFEKYDQPHYLPYLILSYQYAYHLWPGDVYKVFKPPYDAIIKKAFAQPRTYGYGDINSMLPKIPEQMVVDSLVDRFTKDSTFPFTRKLKQNCLVYWVPKAPMQLCACYGDNEVMYQNTLNAYKYMSKYTKNIHMRLFGKHLTHNPCAPFAILYSKMFFDKIRAGKKHPERVPVGKGLLLAIAIDMADHQAKKHYEETGKHETDALASRHIKKR